ncbi:spondin domain-containing protein [Colwellia sp. RE-S-Sl-9]
MKFNKTIAALMLATSSVAVNAQQLEVTVTNLTQGMHYTPLIIAAHTADASLYKLGETASPELQAMAEGGDISGLSTMLAGVNADMVENPAGGLLAPSQSTTAMLDTADGNMYLSIASMLLPTNDAFVALNGWKIPSEAGTYKVMLNAYDAGTEANNELVVMGSGAPGAPGIPAAPGGNAGTGGTGVTSVEANTTVHVHRGNLGDDDLTGGTSDVDNTVHRWLNPVASVTIVVK